MIWRRADSSLLSPLNASRTPGQKFMSSSFSPIPLLVALMALTGPAVAGVPAMPEVDMKIEAAGGPPGADGYAIGLVIDLPDGWHTYWRNPGDAGIPPVFDTSASSNLAAFDIGYPAPRRLADGASTSMVYEGRVVLPVGVVPKDATAPVQLSVSVALGLCRDICLPYAADLKATLDPATSRDETAAADIASFRTMVPRADPDADDRLALRSRTFDAGKGEGHVTVAVRDGGALVDLFATAPEPWYVSPPKVTGRDGDRVLYALEIDGPKGKADLAGVPLTFTWVGHDAAFEIPLRLD